MAVIDFTKRANKYKPLFGLLLPQCFMPFVTALPNPKLQREAIKNYYNIGDDITIALQEATGAFETQAIVIIIYDIAGDMSSVSPRLLPATTDEGSFSIKIENIAVNQNLANVQAGRFSTLLEKYRAIRDGRPANPVGRGASSTRFSFDNYFRDGADSDRNL